MDCLAKKIPVTPNSQASQPPQKPSAKRPVRGSGIGTSALEITTGPKTNSGLPKGTKPSAISVDIPNCELETIHLSEKIKTLEASLSASQAENLEIRTRHSTFLSEMEEKNNQITVLIGHLEVKDFLIAQLKQELSVAIETHPCDPSQTSREQVTQSTQTDRDITTTTTTTTNNSLKHQAAWGQHSYARSSSSLIYLKPLSLHTPRKFPFPLNLYLWHPPNPDKEDLLSV